MAKNNDYYVTRQGQTWDEVAFDVYGDESSAGPLMHLNYDMIDTLVFSAGDVLYTPELVEQVDGDEPPWADDDEGEDLTEGEDPYE